ncbi:MAG: DUF302 domain-containing protein [Burkholderiales bacterium]|nr:DUF302 domain-containing protein [Burkholderiales bacterium]
MATTPFPAKTLSLSCALLLAALLPGAGAAVSAESAENAAPYPGTQTIATRYSFAQLLQRLERAVSENQMGLVAQASASQGAAARGFKIRGNAVLMVFRNDYALRMLEASVPAGIEAPLRLYLTEDPDGAASITYRTPSATFAPYGSSQLDAMARELDAVFAKIVSDASGK